MSQARRWVDAVNEPRRKPQLTDGDAAYCAAAWASGEDQKSLAATFGYKGSSLISVAIGEFIQKFNPPPYELPSNRWAVSDFIWSKARDDAWAHSYCHERKSMIPAALEAFKATL